MASSSSIFQGMVPLGLGFAMLASGLLVAWSYRRRWRQLSGEVERIRTSEAALRGELAGKAEELVQVRRLFEDSPASLLVLGMDGGVLAANRAACALHGLTVEELVHESGGVPSDLMEDVPAELERMATLEGGVVETLRIGSGSRMIPVELRGRPIAYGGRKAVLVHEVDLTTRTRQQALLREEQERYRAVVGALSEGVLLVNAEGRIVTANPSAARILGLMEGDLVGVDLVTAPWRREWMDGTEMAASDAPVAETLSTGEAKREVVMGVQNAAGAKRWLSVTTTPLKRSLNGKVLSVVVSLGDITQLVETQRELEGAGEAVKTVKQANGEFLEYIHHEIRTPLNGLMASYDLLLNSPLTDEQRECVQTGEQWVEDMHTLLSSLLDLAKIEAGRLEIVREAFELRPMLEAALSSFRPRIDRLGIELLLDIDEQLPGWLLGDPHRLRQVLANLVSNALKFTSSGSIQVRVHRMDAERVQFVVADTGIGIAPDKLNLIFELFRQADASVRWRSGGTGVGLVICRQLLGLQQGRIWVESELGLGSQFFFEVPLAFMTAPDPTLAPVATGVLSTPQETSSRPVSRVLIVEDHPVNRQLTETMVQKFGVATAVASNGREALERLEEEVFSMVLMDVQMPEMDGLTATRTWRAREAVLGKSRIPIVALTAHSLPQDKAACLDAGMDDYMCKPLRREALSEMLVRYLSGAAVLRTEVEVAGAKGSGEAGVSGRKPAAGLTQNMRVMLRDANRDGLERVRAAISAGDGAEASRALHFVKGGCALLQAAELTGLLKELEGDAKAGRLDRVAEQLPGLEAMIEALMRRAEIAGA